MDIIRQLLVNNLTGQSQYISFMPVIIVSALTRMQYHEEMKYYLKTVSQDIHLFSFYLMLLIYLYLTHFSIITMERRLSSGIK